MALFIIKEKENHELILNYVMSFPGVKKVLDYGCGEGDLLNILLKNNLDAYGCDIEDRAQHERIKLMNNSCRVPHPDNFFDCLVSNQVLEHVHDMDTMMAEFHRVMKPQAKAILLFPTLDTFIEWHIFLPFVHWFNKLHHLQKGLLYTYAMIGLGHPRPDRKNKKKWVEDRFIFLQNFTRYRFRFSMIKAFKDSGFTVKSIEEEFFYKKYKFPFVFRFFINRYTLPFLLGSVILIRKK